jgi:hypothetical protein
MTNWTDERVVARLTDTFAAHESDADPAAAQRIALAAGPAPRRQWRLLLAAAAAVVLVAGFTTYAVHTTESSHKPATAPTPTVDQTPTIDPIPSPAVAGTNRNLAKTEAARVLATIPVPPGSTRSDSPARRSDRLSAYIGPVDPSLTRTNRWVVPLSYGDLVAWYDANTPADVSSAFLSHATSPQPAGELDWETRDTSTAYSSPAVVVWYARLGAHSTAIRIHVTLAARYDRTSETLVPSTVTSIDITKSAIDGPETPPTKATVSDPALLSSVVSAFNNLDGAFAHTTPMACGSPVGIVYVYAVTFHWPGHTLTVDPGAALCGIGRGLTLDHTKLPQTLTDDHALDAALQAALDAS